MHDIGVGVLIVLLYGNPLLITCLWLMRLAGNGPESPLWRLVLSWLSLSLATAAVGIFWIATLTSAYPQPTAIAPLRFGFYASLTAASGAVLAALFAKGKGRAWAAVSALIVPFNWIMWAAFR